MREKELRQSLAVLTVSSTMKLTGLSARQLRYYESFELVKPQRSTGNQRLYSLNDINRLLEIKDYLDSGMTMKEVRRVLGASIKPEVTATTTSAITDTQARKIFQEDMLRAGQWLDNQGPNSLG
ncbi:MerR family transcriptional regulator [Lactobacillus sp. DCY120]|uniref:MerR family transcriptional regulator n=1 Tax=Bombilactobacillus apium TaxID=2675299 RepID=A0A850R7V1_9LACO|nr:MerR family transcriptional regulator [Bombilactobacillus apium]NVY96927.1 MerR family transcriptional regulator [Bombilactobacillus apium]